MPRKFADRPIPITDELYTPINACILEESCEEEGTATETRVNYILLGTEWTCSNRSLFPYFSNMIDQGFSSVLQTIVRTLNDLRIWFRNKSTKVYSCLNRKDHRNYDESVKRHSTNSEYCSGNIRERRGRKSTITRENRIERTRNKMKSYIFCFWNTRVTTQCREERAETLGTVVQLTRVLATVPALFRKALSERKNSGSIPRRVHHWLRISKWTPKSRVSFN